MLKSFSTGGVHPAENKLTAGFPIEYLPLPPAVTIPVAQHIGAPAIPVVAKGDKVKTGQLIASGKGFVSSNVHSSVSGTVNKIDTIVDGTGFKQTAVFIDVDNDDWVETIDRSSEIKTAVTLSPEEIIKKMSRFGHCRIRRCYFPLSCEIIGSNRKKM